MSDNSIEYETIVRNRNKRKGVSAFVLILIFFALTVACCFAISPLFGINYFGSLFSGEGKKVVKTCYAVVCDAESEDEQTATKLAQNLRSRGGAGIIEKQDNNYFVYLGIYLSENDANFVSNNLKEQDFESSVKTINLIKPSIKSLSSNEQEIYNTSFNFLLETVDTIYVLLNQMETNEITDLTANLRLNGLTLSAEHYNQKLIESSNSLIKDLNTIMASVASILKYVSAEETLTDNSLPYSSEVRRCLARIVLMLR